MKMESNMEPLISVIIPVYNVDKYLYKCIKSITEQSYEKLEIILIDDGSNDNCPLICDKWQEKDKRIIVKHIKNSGVSHARNVGLKVCTGEYILFVDGDDFVDENMISILYKKIASNNADIAVCNYYIYKNSLDYFEQKERIKIKEIMNDDEFINYLFSCIAICGFVWNKLYRRESILGANKIIFDENINMLEDLLFNCEVSKNIKKVCYIKEPLYNYVQRNLSALHSEKIEYKINGLMAHIKIIKFLEEQKNERVWIEKMQFMIGVEIMKYYLHKEKKENHDNVEEIYKYYNKYIKEKTVFKVKKYKKIIKYYILKIIPNIYYMLKK